MEIPDVAFIILGSLGVILLVVLVWICFHFGKLHPTPENMYDEFDKGNTTRYINLTGLGATFVIGLLFFIFGWVTFKHPFQVPSGSRVWILFVVDVLVTLCKQSIAVIHLTTLKWALAKDGRLEFNSNLRLIRTADSGSFVNKPLGNVIMTFLLLLSYSLAPFIFVQAPQISSASLTTVISPIALVLLGICFCIQSFLACLALRKTQIPTWSKDPLHTTAAAISMGFIKRRPNRCMVGLDLQEKYPPGEPAQVMPREKQSSMGSTPGFHIIVYSFVVLWVCLFPAVAGSALLMKGPLQLLSTNKGWVQLCEVTALQAPVTLWLHLLGNLANSRLDEHIWRRASHKGARLLIIFEDYYLFPALIILLAMETLLHWLFGLVVNPGQGERLHQYLALAGFVVLAVISFVWFCWAVLFFGKPRGPQPAAYGHIRTLADLVDEWSPKMYWGHKSGERGVCHAGTSTSRLPVVFMDRPYAGCQPSLDDEGVMARTRQTG